MKIAAHTITVTERAVQVEVEVVFDSITNETRKVWFPKSQIEDSGEGWIQPSAWIVSAKLADLDFMDAMEPVCAESFVEYTGDIDAEIEITDEMFAALDC